jgi:hypothetical protein
MFRRVGKSQHRRARNGRKGRRPKGILWEFNYDGMFAKEQIKGFWKRHWRRYWRRQGKVETQREAGL